MTKASSTYRFGEFTLDESRGCLLRGGEEIKLRPKVYDALKYLVENPGRLVEKQELMSAVWPDGFVTDDSLVQCAVELRRALDDRTQRLLRTVPRRGYIFAADVVQRSASSTEICKLPAEGAAPSRVALPAPRASLVGRERELALAAEILSRPNVRLLSLTGAGGSGKTRLAIALASAQTDRFSAGVQFVGLASIAHPDLLATALCEALGVQRAAHRSVAESIAERLHGGGPFLMVLDNFEHLLGAAATVGDILAACPSLKIVVTTRQSLRIYGEQEFPVTPLEPDSAVELFVQRACAVRPAFRVTAANAQDIRNICARLDCLPLAIELAAARTKVLSPAAILERLQSRMQLLTAGALDMPERQQTLRKTIDWSYDLLSEAEQRLFRRLGVFSGGCTIEAAEAVCDARRDLAIDPFDGLSSLVDKNLVQCDDNTGSDPRFTMLETIRDYALARLTDAGEDAGVRRAHAAYCLVRAEEGNPELSPAERAAWLAGCDAEIDNFRSALDWLFATKDAGWSLRLCMALFRFWDMREHLSEGRARLETVLQLAGTEHASERARVMHFLGALATAQGDFAAAKHYLEQSLSLYEESGDRWGIAASLNALAVSARDRGDYPAAQTFFERSLACWRDLPDRLSTARCLHNLANAAKVCGRYAQASTALHEAASIFSELGDTSGAAWSINQQGDIAREQGDIVQARALYERALASFSAAADSWGSARSLSDLGHVYCEQQEYAAAHEAYREALDIFSELGYRRGTARALEGVAALAAAQRDAQRALKLAASAAHARALIGAPLPPAEQAKLDGALAPARQSLSERDAALAWTDGSAMSLEDAVRYAVEPVPAVS